MDVSYKVIYLLKCWSTLTIDVHKGGGQSPHLMAQLLKNAR